MTDIETWRFIMDYGPLIFLTVIVVLVAGLVWLILALTKRNPPSA